MKRQSNLASRLPALCLLAGGVFCLGLGLARGESFPVLQKAIHICLECVGIG